MKTIKVIATFVLSANMSSCSDSNISNTLKVDMNNLRDIQQQIEKQEYKTKEKTIILGYDYDIDSPNDFITLSGGVKIQTKATKLKYPYIDGATEECRKLTENEIQLKRQNPEINISCKE